MCLDMYLGGSIDCGRALLATAQMNSGERAAREVPVNLRGRLDEKIAPCAVVEINDEEREMFKYIGGAVVYGFALYGLTKYLMRNSTRLRYEREPEK